ncbi:hypothetical protein CSKR_100757 [Clonorchis sinensis]|uniref:Uncharacterized protein n=1 Tax=Clonorchis sinensis TaxID=79923 RepID=A0A3R7GBL9_CLOSI|nr:hypothetical protein CSKR_100757 [Clonorchis sinensis]
MQMLVHHDDDALDTYSVIPGEMAQWLEHEFTNRKVYGSNPTVASRLPLSRLGKPGSITSLVLPSGGMVTVCDVIYLDSKMIYWWAPCCQVILKVLPQENNINSAQKPLDTI